MTENKIDINKLKYPILLLIFFLIGIICGVKFNNQIKIIFSKNFNKIINNTSKEINSTFEPSEKIIININFKNFQNIIESRNKGLKKKFLLDEDKKWTKAKMVYDNNEYNIDIKLKGAMPSNFDDLDKIGFKIKVTDFDKRFLGMREFSLQHPEEQNFIGEILFQKILDMKGLPYLRTKNFYLNINGKNYGLYLMQENLSKEFLENNKLRENPIVGYDKENFLKFLSSREKYEMLDHVDVNDSFLTSEIRVSNSNNLTIYSKLKKNSDYSIFLLEQFRQKKLKTSEVFDHEMLAKLMAIRVLMGSENFDWRDIKFYFDPFKKKLIPIGKELNSDGKISDKGWWIKTNLSQLSKNEKDFLELIYNDDKYYEQYLKELFLIKDLNIEDFFSKMNLPEELRQIYLNYPLRKQKIDKSVIIYNQAAIKNFFSNLNFNSEINNEKISFKNFSRLPIRIDGVKIDEKHLRFKKSIILDGKEIDSTSSEEIFF